MTTKQTSHDHGNRKDQGEPAAPPKQAEAKPAEEPTPQQKNVAEIPGARGVMAFARRHPLLTVLGVASVGLFGGVEIAAAMIVGAGVAAVVTRPGEAGEQAHVVRERARGFLARKPEIRNRARAVVAAVRGKIHTNGHNA